MVSISSRRGDDRVRVVRLDIHRFRGIKDLTLHPRGHVVLVGEPRSGRSTVLEGLRRALSPDGTRFPLGDDLDFYQRETSEPIAIEVVLGELGPQLEHDFFDYLELWDEEAGEVVAETRDPTKVDEDAPLVVRLADRARWSDDAEHAEHWVDFPKAFNPEHEQFARAPPAAHGGALRVRQPRSTSAWADGTRRFPLAGGAR
jgi:hypothetical protein